VQAFQPSSHDHGVARAARPDDLQGGAQHCAECGSVVSVLSSGTPSGTPTTTYQRALLIERARETRRQSREVRQRVDAFVQRQLSNGPVDPLD
jgi:hypothetical protein